MPRATKVCLRCRLPVLRDGRCQAHQLRRGWDRESPRNASRPSDWSRRKARVLARDSFACTQCGGREALEVDHVVPVSRGGGWEETNLQTLCGGCHSRKTYRTDHRA